MAGLGLGVKAVVALVIPLGAFAAPPARVHDARGKVDCIGECAVPSFTPKQSGMLRVFAAEFETRSARRDSLAIEPLSRRPHANWRFHASQRSCKDALSELGSCDEAYLRGRDIQRKPVAFPGDR